MADGNDVQGDEIDGDIIDADSPATDESGEIAPEVQAKFDEVFGGNNRRAADREAADELAEEGLEDQDSIARGEDEPQDDDSADDDEPAGDGDQDGAGEDEGSNESEAPGVAESLKQIARDSGWTEDEIKELVEANPELASKTFEKIAGAYNGLSLQYARLGASPQNGATHQNAGGGATAPAKSKLDELFSDEGLKAFAEVNGEELVEKFVKPLRDEVFAPLQRMRADYERREQESLVREITAAVDGFSSELPEFYGKKGETPDNAQAANRERVYRLADQIRAGAFAQGVELSITDALRRAHLIETASLRGQKARKEVVASVKNRTRAISARPNGRRKNVSAKPGDSTAADAYAKRAAELGIEIGD